MTFQADGFTIVSDREYSKRLPSDLFMCSSTDAGEEMYISYGNHSNDFLLAECWS